MKESPLHKLNRLINENPMKQLGTHKSFKKARARSAILERMKDEHDLEQERSKRGYGKRANY